MDSSGLDSAIRSGDVVRAGKIAESLAARKVRLSVQMDENADLSLTFPDNKISIQICIEDRHISGIHLTWKLAPSLTIYTLKMLMFERFGFPPEVQKWISGKRVLVDLETISQGSAQNDEMFYLYLLPARCVGLTKEIVRQRYGTSLHGFGNTLFMGNDITDLGLERGSSSNGIDQRGTSSNVINQRGASVVSNGTVRQNVDVQKQDGIGWSCPVCTFFNQPTRPGCEVCAEPRPENFVIPASYQLTEAEKKRLEHERKMEIENERLLIADRTRNYDELLATEETHLIVSVEQFTCPICMEVIDVGGGVMLRDCLHSFCRECLINQIKYSESSIVSCPYADDRYQCTGSLQQREIQSLVSSDLYQRYLSLSLKEAESRMPNTFHCQTPNCNGFCVYEEDVNTFPCPICLKENCLTCKAIHDDLTCKQYQKELELKSVNDVAAKKTHDKIKAMLAKGDAMNCPTCDIIVMKKDGCDWIMCTMCKTELCWVTKQARWGPEGSGDISGGCRCGVDSRPCHPNCQNCH